MNGVEDGVRDADRQLLLFDHFSPGDAWEKIDGVITTGEELPSALGAIPAVSLLRQSRHMTSILADNVGGTRAAVRHLLDLGHSRIGCLMFSDDPYSCQKVRGYQAELKNAGVLFNPAWLRSLTEPGQNNFNFLKYGEKRMATWLREDWKALGLTAVICENDQTAIGAMAALRDAGISVPNQVSVIGFDGTEISKYSHPALTTVALPLDEIGRRGVAELVLQIEEYESRIREIVLPAQLQVGRSTASPPLT
jgi:LacI family transcriptional regulator